ncbi:hypothetical protein E2320_021722 [Naja naja]|nr:hypothetical protein E2320_021722 [Naja naja]
MKRRILGKTQTTKHLPSLILTAGPGEEASCRAPEATISSRLGGPNVSLETTGWHRAASCRYAEGRPIAPWSLGKGRENSDGPRRACALATTAPAAASRARRRLLAASLGEGKRAAAAGAAGGGSPLLLQQRRRRPRRQNSRGPSPLLQRPSKTTSAVRPQHRL